jgi:hypothetical protein
LETNLLLWICYFHDFWINIYCGKNMGHYFLGLPHSLQLGSWQVATSAAYRIHKSGPQQLDGASLLYSLVSATMKTNVSTTRATMKQM